MKTQEQLSNEIADETTYNSLIKALSLLLEAKDQLNTADNNNAKDEWMGDIPTIGSEIGEQAYNLKNMLGIPLNQDEIDYYAQPESNKKPVTSAIQSEDNLGLHIAVNGLYLAIEKDDLETALKYVGWIENITRTYADPRSEAHDHLHFFSQVQALYSAIDVEDNHQVNKIINKISAIANDGIKRAKFDNKFNEEWNASHNQ
ncbi:hypothetical protein PAF15_06640 [Weissella koreensis]|uniref:hypothetical protein n=1 Tax=Weissella koreensis TaxID=165096 RepID=UPI0022BA2CF3|nr:hypothetical protein [Weissella koreensis]MCZ9311616.1 hypothetical protein [Weissella koreensis]